MFRRGRKDASARQAVPDALDRPSHHWPPAIWTPLTGPSGACCCSAAAKVQLVMVPAGGRGPVELLLCGHHYRVSSPALVTTGAAAFDLDGMPLLDPGGNHLGVPADHQPLATPTPR